MFLFMLFKHSTFEILSLNLFIVFRDDELSRIYGSNIYEAILRLFSDCIASNY